MDRAWHSWVGTCADRAWHAGRLDVWIRLDSHGRFLDLDCAELGKDREMKLDADEKEWGRTWTCSLAW